jgi:hypothetical protein
VASGNGSDREIYIADIEPGSEFVRDYIVKCKRKSFAVTSYAIRFDCRYLFREKERALTYLKSQSFTGAIAPSPWKTSALAAGFSVVGVGLKTCLNLIHEGRPNRAAIVDVVYSGSMIVSLIAAVLTALLFYNVVEWTALGKKVESGAGWRTAIIIGGLSGLLNEKVVAALEDLFG